MSLNEYVLHNSLAKPLAPASGASIVLASELACADWDFIQVNAKITNSATGDGQVLALEFDWYDRQEVLTGSFDTTATNITSFTWPTDGSGGDANALAVPNFTWWQPTLRMPVQSRFVTIRLTNVGLGAGAVPSIGLVLTGGVNNGHQHPLSMPNDNAPIQIPGLITLAAATSRTFYVLNTHCSPLWLMIQHLPGAVGNNQIAIIDRIDGFGLASRVATYEYLPGFGTTAGQQLPPFRERLPMDGHVWRIQIINFGLVAVNASWLFQCQVYQEMG